MTRRKLSKVQRAFLAAYNPFFGRMLGWRQDSINAEFVRTFGVGALLKFGKTVGDTLALLSKQYGDAFAQHLVGFAGMMNGCRFCGVGHNLTGNIMLFKDQGVLFPIDELEIPEMQNLKDEEILSLFETRMTGTEFEGQLPLFRRMFELRNGATEDSSNDDDLYLSTALALWSWNNECTIETGFDIDPNDVPSFAKFNKDHTLYRRYRDAREQTAANPLSSVPPN